MGAMILYEAISSYHLLCACVDRMKCQTEPAALLIWKRRLDSFHNIELLTALFDDIIEYDSFYQLYHSDDSVKKYFCQILHAKHPINSKFERIICACGHHAFGYFLAISNTPFVFCEDAAGLLSRPEILENLNEKVPNRKYFNEKCSKLGLYDGSNSNIVARRCNIKAQLPGFDAKNVEDFDVVKSMYDLPSEDRNRILSFFSPDIRLSVLPKSTLILTQHFANLSTLSFNQQVLIYQLFVDYFFKDTPLVFKPHPDDLMYYGQLFPEAQIIRERFPSEFLPFVLDNQPDCIATISSTSVYNLRGHFPKVFELDTRYESDFPMTHRYYAALKIAQKIGLNVVCVGANEVLARRLSETLGEGTPQISTEIPDSKSAYVYLIDNVTASGERGRADVVNLLHSLQAGSCAVMINSQDDYCWYSYKEKSLWNDIAPLVLKKVPMLPKSEDFYASLEDETIYIYAKDKELLKMAKETAINKELPHTGIMLENWSLDSRDEKIKMLEGILAATEKRLLYYIEKEKSSQ